MKKTDRRSFIKTAAAAGLGTGILGSSAFARSPQTGSATQAGKAREEARIGIIGLDTSHSPAFTRLINNPEDPKSEGFRVTAAHPYGSRNIEASNSRIPGITETMRELGVDIIDSLDDLIDQSDFILLETNDGHPHLEQALQVMEAGKTLFIDKPVAGSLKDTIAIFNASRRLGVPTFSSSSLRYITNAAEVRSGELIGQVTGADAYSSASREETHPDLFWYGIHGVEILFTVLKTGCQSVRRLETDVSDIVVGQWDGDRVGTFRGIREGRGGIGGIAFGTESILTLGPSQGYTPLVHEILEFFRTGTPPVDMEETIEIYAFMEAADESKRQGGAEVALADVLANATA